MDVVDCGGALKRLIEARRVFIAGGAPPTAWGGADVFLEYGVFGH